MARLAPSNLKIREIAVLWLVLLLMAGVAANEPKDGARNKHNKSKTRQYHDQEMEDIYEENPNDDGDLTVVTSHQDNDTESTDDAYIVAGKGAKSGLSHKTATGKGKGSKSSKSHKHSTKSSKKGKGGE